MQFEPSFSIFDTETFTIEHPISPEGSLFTYYPSEVPPNLHYHDFLEIGYCERGSGIFIIDGEPIPFNGKCTAIIYEGQTHIAKSLSPEKSLWHFLYIDLRKLFSSGVFIDNAFLQRLKCSNINAYRFPNIISEKEQPIIYNLCRQILTESANAKENFIYSIQGLLYSLLIMHERLFTSVETYNAPLRHIDKNNLLSEIGETLNYISKHYMEPITIEDLIEISNMSKSNLRRKMISYTGLPPMQYIHSLRMKHASLEIIDGRKSIEQIAQDVGYSLSCFSRQFRKYYDVSPTEWKKHHEEEGKQ